MKKFRLKDLPRDERGIPLYHPFTYLPPKEQIRIANKFNKGFKNATSPKETLFKEI